jgi:glycosyltransferase involved in cell wall biosynthesis
VKRAIDSVLAQTYDDFEIVVVDDCSTDDTPVVVRGYDDDRVRYIRHDENQGACAARNTGIKHSEGRYIAFLDSDDEWDETKLSKQVECIESESRSVGVVYTGYRVQRSDSLELGQVPSKSGDIHRDQLTKDWVSPTSAVLVKKACFDSVGVFDTELQARQDYEMWLRISQKFKFEYVKEPLVILHQDVSNRITSNVQSRMAAHQELLERISGEIDDLSPHERRVVLSTQYFTMARYLQKNGRYKKSLQYYAKSLISNPINYKSWLCLLFCLFGMNPDTGQGLKIKSVIKQIIY